MQLDSRNLFAVSGARDCNYGFREKSYNGKYGGALFMFIGERAGNVLCESPLWLYKHCMASRAMSQYYLAIRGSKMRGAFDLNSEALTVVDSNGVARSKLSVDCFPVKTPADLGQRNELAVIDEAQALVVIQNFAQCQELGRYVEF